MIADAKAADPEHVDSYVDGVGQDLPVEDSSADVVVFSYSLHHVPAEHIADALVEAKRVLRPGGPRRRAERIYRDAKRTLRQWLLLRRLRRTRTQSRSHRPDARRDVRLGVRPSQRAVRSVRRRRPRWLLVRTSRAPARLQEGGLSGDVSRGHAPKELSPRQLFLLNFQPVTLVPWGSPLTI